MTDQPSMFPDPAGPANNVVEIKRQLHVLRSNLRRDHYERQAQLHDDNVAGSERRGERGKAHKAREKAKWWRKEGVHARAEVAELEAQLEELSRNWGEG